MSYSEMLERKSHGICFRCGEKFTPLHQCADRQLRVIILGDHESVNDAGEVVAIEVEEGKEEEMLECKIMGLCGITKELASRKESRTMKLIGKIGGIPLVVLVDSGASHNFISPEVVLDLGLKAEATYQMGVRLGDSHRIQTQGRYPVVQIQLGELEIVVETCIIELGRIDLILGVRWLETLGKVIVDWKEMTISFVKDRKAIILRNSDKSQKGEEEAVEP